MKNPEGLLKTDEQAQASSVATTTIHLQRRRLSSCGWHAFLESCAQKVTKNFKDVRVLIFSTAQEVTNHKQKQWKEDLRKEFDLELIVVTREELVTSLMDPANAAICSAQLGIPVETKPELEDVLGRAWLAAAEVIADWENRPRLAGRPLIELDAETTEEAQEQRTRVAIDLLRQSLAEGRRIILGAPAGRGKTTTLIQLAKRSVYPGGHGSLRAQFESLKFANRSLEQKNAYECGEAFLRADSSKTATQQWPKR